ncbi:hypothetical protein P7K49_021180 [Saguinus oedipus]|uniref:Uncharacterized protein n=1 Tax=Saguinus oedipus TaxID=9490 RepID=A0ABQ9UUA0_SAGOE|nr:hypothetical protein P7K49_021180 [Saguinus oedipus]
MGSSPLLRCQKIRVGDVDQGLQPLGTASFLNLVVEARPPPFLGTRPRCPAMSVGSRTECLSPASVVTKEDWLGDAGLA